MIEPMLVRLAGCIVFAGLLSALVMTTTLPRNDATPDAVVAAAMQERVERVAFTRP